MNLILVEPNVVESDGTVTLVGRQSHHAREVLAVSVGARVRVGIVRGPSGHATVARVEGDRVVLELDADVRAAPAATPPGVDVILAMPRPKVVTRVVATLASMGVGRIDLVNSWRVHKSYFATDRVSTAALNDALRLGCEQGTSTWVPDVAVHSLLMTFVREVLPSNLEHVGHRLVAHPRTSAHMEAVLPPGTDRRVVVAIGPEGGWIEREVETFVERGFSPVAIGPHVLKVEAAAVALLAQLELIRRM